MMNHRLPDTILHAASLLAPRDQRAFWLQEWQSELWYIPPHEAKRFCLGAFQDALWLRRNRPEREDLSAAKRKGSYLESPFRCLAVLSTLAAVSLVMTSHLERMLPFPEVHGRSALDGFAEFLLFYLLLAMIAFLIGDSPGHHRAMPRPSTVRSWIFLTLKIALLLPVLQGMLVLIIVANVPFFSLGFFTAYMLLVRWVFTDQRRRCPVCLRLLMNPVRIGIPSQTFLAWYGAESVCARGHGLLHASEVSSDSVATQRWLRLDESWKELFSKGAGTWP